MIDTTYPSPNYSCFSPVSSSSDSAPPVSPSASSSSSSTPLPSIPPVRFFQNNVNRANTITHAILNSFTDDFDILLLQEPWRGRIGTARSDDDPDGREIFGEPQQKSWRQYLPVPGSVGTDTPSRVTAYVNRGRSDLRVVGRTDLLEHPDAIILELQIGDFSCLIINVYNDPRESVIPLLTTIPLPDLPICITGDFNMHHDLWSEGDSSKTTGRTEDMVDWMTSNGFTLLNQKGEVTFARRSHHSVLDLTWINEEFVSDDRFQNWRVREDLDSGSDHIPITWEIDLGGFHPHIGPDSGVFGFKAEHQKPWLTALSSAVSTHFPHHVLTVEHPTEHDLDLSITGFMRALEQATSQTIPIKKFSAKANPWWSDELRVALQNVRTLRKVLKDERSTHGTPSRDAQTNYSRANNFFKRLVQTAKQKWAMEFAASIETDKVWKLTNWHKGIRRHTAPPIKRPDGSMAITPEDKCNVFRESFFPPPAVLDGTFHTDLSVPHPSSRPFHDVTFEEIDHAIGGVSNDTAPGFSRIPYRAIKWAWKVYSAEMTFIYKTALQLGVHHDSWKRAITVVIPKPGKPSYSAPRAYRPIQLLECLGKILEKIVASRLMHDIGKHNLVPLVQFGGRTASSCVDAGLSLVHDIQSGWKHGLVASTLAIDVKGFFDKINHERLVHVLWEMGFPPQISKWVQSFLLNRQAALRLDDHMDSMLPIIIGVPQGSPCSPVLSIIYGADPIRRLCEDESLRSSVGTHISPFSYIDDISITSFSDSLEDNVTTLKRGLSVAVEELGRIGMEIDPDKTELQHFSRRPRDSCPAFAANIYGKQLSVVPTKAMRWLGIFFDRRLSFNEHVKIMCARSSSIITGLRVLANTVRGLSQSNLRLLYRTCVLPVLTYASAVWYRPDKRQASLIRQLETTQNKALRHICGAFRTTPCHALRLLSHIPPISLTLDRFSMNAAARFAKLPLLSPVTQRLPNSFRNRRLPVSITPFSTPPSVIKTNPTRNTTLQHLSRLTFPNADSIDVFRSECDPSRSHLSRLSRRLNCISYCPPPGQPRDVHTQELNSRHVHARSDPSTILAYCDGSRHRVGRDGTGPKQSGSAGIVYYLGEPVVHFQFGLGRRSTIYDAELFALAWASSKVAKYIASLPSPSPIRSVFFFSDNTSAIKTIANPFTHSSQSASLLFLHHISSITSLSPQVQVTVDWSPGHAGVLGNEKVDQLAKAAVSLPPTIGPTFSYLRHRSKRHIKVTWKRIWSTTDKHGQFGKVDTKPPSTTVSPTFKHTPRELFGRLTQLLTGHGYIGDFYQRFIPSESPWCTCTDEVTSPTLQTREHIIFQCPHYANHRQRLRKYFPDFDSPDFTTVHLLDEKHGLPHLLRFLKRTGAFTKRGVPLNFDLPTRDPPDLPAVSQATTPTPPPHPPD